MSGKQTPSFVLELPLSADGGDGPVLSARFEAVRQLYNAVLGEALRRMSLMKESKEWQKARDLSPKPGNGPGPLPSAPGASDSPTTTFNRMEPGAKTGAGSGNISMPMWRRARRPGPSGRRSAIFSGRQENRGSRRSGRACRRWKEKATPRESGGGSTG